MAPTDELWARLPLPADDGAADHLRDAAVPEIALEATDGSMITLARLPGWSVVFVYPRTFGAEPPDEVELARWEAVPGARGCTPQACSYRDEQARFSALGVRVLGLSAQTSAEQREARERLHLRYELLSDSDLRLARALGLPTFDFGGRTLLKRLTLITRDGRIEHVWYPVFPPDADASKTADWLTHRLGALD